MTTLAARRTTCRWTTSGSAAATVGSRNSPDYSWKDLDEAESSPKPMMFWMKALVAP